jgi:hypothetical protein
MTSKIRFEEVAFPRESDQELIVKVETNGRYDEIGQLNSYRGTWWYSDWSEGEDTYFDEDRVQTLAEARLATMNWLKLNDYGELELVK